MRNPVQHQRTKHIEMNIYFIYEKVPKGEVCIIHIPSRYQIADIFTKGLLRVLSYNFRDNLIHGQHMHKNHCKINFLSLLKL